MDPYSSSYCCGFMDAMGSDTAMPFTGEWLVGLSVFVQHLNREPGGPGC